MEQNVNIVYPSHLRSEIFQFDGVLPNQRLGELSHDNQLRLFRLNGVLNQPCTARFYNRFRLNYGGGRIHRSGTQIR